MIINAISDIKHIGTTSQFNIVPEKYYNSEYSFMKTPVKLQVINTNITNCSIVFDFINSINFKSFAFDFTSNKVPIVKYFYSYDDSNYEELPYVMFKLNGTLPDENEQNLLKKYENTIFKVKKIHSTSQRINMLSQRIYTIFDKETNSIKAIPVYDLEVLVKHLDNAYHDENYVIGIEYVWEYLHASGSYVSLYNDFSFRFLKIVFSKFDASPTIPFNIENMYVYVDAVISELPFNNISMFTDDMFKQKYFETYDFLPSITKSYFEMLEYSDKEINKAIPDINLDFVLSSNDNTIHLISPLEFNFDKTYNPLLIFNLDVDGRIYEYSYQELPTVYTDINNMLANIFANGTNVLTITCKLYLSKFSLTKTRIYSYPYLPSGDGWMDI